MDPQLASPIFRLPRELRDQIYITLFSSTRLTFGERTLGRIESQRMKPAPNSLAILRSCRRIHEEAKALWLGHVLFNFEHAEDLMDKLSPLSEAILSQIRFVRTGGRPVMFSFPGEDYDVYYRVPFILKLLPGLRLDTLTVLADTGPEVAYQTLEMFIQHGHGWKELHFICHTSSVLAYSDESSHGPSSYRREPQPGAWHETLLRRDGRDSGASVVIYRSTCPGVPGSVLNPDSRQPFSQIVSSREQLAKFGEMADQRLYTGNEKKKEVLIVAKRGRGADISDVGTSPYSADDPRDWGANEKTWAQIRHEFIDYKPSWMEDLDDELLSDSGNEEAEADVYSDPNEYVVPPIDLFEAM
ncbi:hypothetical protein GX50_07884 [[Emmonsia] crescens]|uniref:F-box domain-containing protein n=1 Tax=[Emmonsia] crescens TaxID=73230 RepID=A0A2B7Z7H6_9EURO|nr:hypothetical protein GX50_07884 [Emmonsia crescens]